MDTGLVAGVLFFEPLNQRKQSIRFPNAVSLVRPDRGNDSGDVLLLSRSELQRNWRDKYRRETPASPDDVYECASSSAVPV